MHVVIVHLARGGKPAADMELFAVLRVADSRNMMSWPIGKSGPDGTVKAEIDGDLVFDLEVSTASYEPIALVGTALAATPGGRIERTYEISAGRLVVELPPSLVVPSAGVVSVGLKTAAGEMRSLTAATPKAPRTIRSTTVWMGWTIEFDDVQLGEYEATVSIQSFDTDPSLPGGHKPVAVREPHKAKIRIEADRETKIVVP